MPLCVDSMKATGENGVFMLAVDRLKETVLADLANLSLHLVGFVNQLMPRACF